MKRKVTKYMNGGYSFCYSIIIDPTNSWNDLKVWADFFHNQKSSINFNIQTSRATPLQAELIAKATLKLSNAIRKHNKLLDKSK